MTYRDKLKAFDEGTLSENEAAEIEKDIDKFEALLDYFDSVSTPVALKGDSDADGFTGEINRAVNKKVTSMVLRTVMSVILFVFLFIFGLSTNYLARLFGGSDLTQHILEGIYALVFVPTAAYMMYRMLVKKEKAPAIILLVWNIAPAILTFVISNIIGDAFAVFLPAYYGFSVIPSTVSSLFSGGVFESIGAVFGIGGMLFSSAFSIASLILIKKPKQFKQILFKKGITALCIFLAAGTALFAAGTAKEISDGAFPNSKICSDAMAEKISESGEAVFSCDILGKTIEEADAIYTSAGLVKSNYTESEKHYLRYTKSSPNVMQLELPVTESGKVEAVSYNSGYICKYLYISIDNINSIPDDYMGKSEKEVMRDFISFRLLPAYVSYSTENGKNIAEYHYVTDIPASEYNFRFFSNIDITFENGIMTAATAN